MSRLRTFVLALLALCMPWAVPAAGQPGPPPEASRFSQEELDQLLAPIALYPDQLLAQVLMAATYPFEVVLAARFVQQNPGLAGDALDQEVARRNWDPSVQSLAAFPQVLTMMSDRLDWTQRLGDAFLADQQRVMDTVQGLRGRAQAAGNLEVTPQQTVVVRSDEILIQPAQPEVIYVPVYDPLVIYGPWWAPAYPPWFWYPPAIYGYPLWPVFGVGIWFGTGYVVSHHHWGWAHPDWHRRHIAVDTHDNRFWDRPGHRPPSGGTWEHSPDHRRGVAYADTATRNRFMPVDPNAVRARENFRGRDLVPPAGTTRPAGSSAGTLQPTPPSVRRPPSDAPSTSAVRPAPGPVAPAQRPATGATGPAQRPSTSAVQRPTIGAAPPTSPAPATSAMQSRPSPGISLPAPQVRPIAPPRASVFDPGLSRQQAEINAQRGYTSRQSIAPPPAPSRMPAAPPAMRSAPAPSPAMRAPAPSPALRAPAPSGAHAPAAPRGR
ncbi:MAG TPA: DUF3300 domain-containing protein [Casimicrobiaceae bacterium]